MGYVISSVIKLPHCHNCWDRISKCEYCKKDLTNNKNVLCLDENSKIYERLNIKGHCCSKKCYNNYNKKYME